jgi:hypothetical protein
MHSSLLLLALVLTAGACATPPNDAAVMDDAPTSRSGSEERTVPLDEPFTVEVGERVLLANEGGAALQFNGVTNDSRCPANATCVRAGEAFANFTLYEDGNARPFELEIEGLVMEVQDIERYQFQTVDRFVAALLLLQPYPGLDEEEEMPVTATVEMRRLMR